MKKIEALTADLAAARAEAAHVAEKLDRLSKLYDDAATESSLIQIALQRAIQTTSNRLLVPTKWDPTLGSGDV